MSGNIAWNPTATSITEALYIRLSRAIRNREDFRVMVVIPVHPDGAIRTMRAIQLVLYWQMCTISRGGQSLLERLHREFPDADLGRYIQFCALRQVGFLQGQPLTEQIYVHSKLMIVDDRVVLVGSANINDRSQFGYRDSEIALIIKGGDPVMTRMAGKPWRASLFAHTLRRSLMEEHLDLAHTHSFLSEKSTRGVYPLGATKPAISEVLVGGGSSSSSTSEDVKSRFVQSASESTSSLTDSELNQLTKSVSSMRESDEGQPNQQDYTREQRAEEIIRNKMPQSNVHNNGCVNRLSAPTPAHFAIARRLHASQDAALRAVSRRAAVLSSRRIDTSKITGSESGQGVAALLRMSSRAKKDREAMRDPQLADAEEENGGQPGRGSGNEGTPNTLFHPLMSPGYALAAYPVVDRTSVVTSLARPASWRDLPQCQNLKIDKLMRLFDFRGLPEHVQSNASGPSTNQSDSSSSSAEVLDDGGTIAPFGVKGYVSGALLESLYSYMHHRHRYGSSSATQGAKESTAPEQDSKNLAENVGASVDADERAEFELPALTQDGLVDRRTGKPYRYHKDYETVVKTKDAVLTAVAFRQLSLRPYGAGRCACDALMDPCCPITFDDIILAAARNNTKIFSTTFPGVIQDSIKTIEEWREREKLPPNGPELLDGLMGKLVQWPTGFLERSNLAPKRSEKEYYAPARICQ